MTEEAKWFQYEVFNVSEIGQEWRVEISAEAVKKEEESILQQLTSRAKIPGFRVGKAPREIVRRVLAADLKERLINRLVPKALTEIMEANQISPAGEPVIQGISWQEGQPLRFRAHIEVWPEFELPDYKKIKVPFPEIEVKEEEISQAMAQLQQRATEFHPVKERGLGKGDYALLEVKMKDLKTKKLRPTQKIQWEAGHPGNDQLWEEKITGMKPGEERVFTYDFPPEYPDHDLAGRQMQCSVRLLALREKRVPEIDDQFARSLGNFDNLDQLKERLREELMSRKREEARRAVIDEILEKIKKEISFPLPEVAIEEEKHAILERWLSSRPDQNWTEAEIKALEREARQQAEKNLKDRLILEKVAKKEGMRVAETELEEEIRTLARANRVSALDLKERLSREGKMESLRRNLLLRKAVDFLTQQAL